MRTYCTLFDVNYLTRALVLHHSLARSSGRFRLFAFCMDEASVGVLRRLDLAGVEIVPLRALEEHDAQLLSTKHDRTQVEYCWTATPAVCRYVLETQPGVDEVTYLDADLQFFSDPEPLFDELGDDAVLIVPHRYAPEHRHKEPTSGTYNVEWLTFRRDDDGLAVLQWWHERCIEWCYFRWEDGKLGDQKYLDEFPRLFERVHVLEHPGGGLAPWNVTAHELEQQDGRVLVDGRPLVFYHHHSLRLYRNDAVGRLATVLGRVEPGVPPVRRPWRTSYPIGGAERRLVWQPYLRALGEAEREAAAGAPPVDRFPAEELARSVARLGLRTVRTARSRIDLARLRPGTLTRYVDSWRSGDVARQMLELTDEQLQAPEEVAPYHAFRELLPALPERGRFLDIGAGAGAYGELLERWAPGRFAYTGADYSEEIVEAARSRWPGRTFERRDLFEPGALDGFDVVFASALLDVVPDVDGALSALLGCDAGCVVLHRQRIDERTRVEVVAGYRGQRTYRTYLDLPRLEQEAAAHGREVAASVPVDGAVWSFVLRRT